MAVWENGEAYETYIGRWSRTVAREFLQWVGAKPGSRWLDVGCGTGALTETILGHSSPAEVVGVDPSDAYLKFASDQMKGHYARFEKGDASALPFGEATFDVVVSGLALNFVSDKAKAVSEMARVVRPKGRVAFYVWDYAGKMELIRYFWDAAVGLNPHAAGFDEGRRFPICNREPLALLPVEGGLKRIEVKAIDIPTVFRSFAEYWTPFLGGQGPASEYALSLSETDREALRQRLLEMLPIEDDGSIHLLARAWAVRCIK